MSDETKGEVTEEVTKAKSIIETIIDENRATTNEDLLKLTCGKKEIETAIVDFKAFKKHYELPSIKAKYYEVDDETWEIKDPDVLSDSIDELRIYTRQYAIAKEKRLLYIIRQEELISLVNEIQGRLEKYDKFAKSVNNDQQKLGQEFTNAQLQEFAMYKSQTIPMYMVELETLASSIHDNEETYIESGIKINEITSGIIKYLENQVS
jgi:hypothetical protein